MTNEFWENAFQEKQMMWGDTPTRAAVETAQLFKGHGFQKVLIPGFGYGRNAKVFLDTSMAVTGIEISETAIAIARTLFKPELRIFHGPVSQMPFDTEKYDGIFCHALIHLLDSDGRKKLIQDCYNQLASNGMMVFTAITKTASTFGTGEQISKDRFKTKDGVELFFYDDHSISEEFASYGLTAVVKIPEPVNGNSSLTTEFWKIICQRSDQG